MERFSYAGTPCCDVGCEITLMFLRAAHQKGRDACDTNAAPDVSHQVIDSGCIADLLFAQPAHGHGGEGHKDEATRKAIEHIRHDDGHHGHLEIDATQQDGRVAEYRETDCQHQTFIDIPDQYPCHRSEEHTSELQSLRHLVCR